MKSLLASTASLLLAYSFLANGRAAAQAPALNDSRVQTIAASEPAPGSRKFVRFQQQPAHVGDRVTQELGVHLDLKTTIIQSGQTAHESSNVMRRQQRRVIDVLEAAEGRATRVRAEFPVSRRQSPEMGSPDELARQPIEGKSYLMHREGEQLLVTDLEGRTPPLEEFKLVAESLENVGKPNPLAELLMSRAVVVGESFLVPRALVQQLLGFDDPVGTVRRFELTLVQLLPADERNPTERAVFTSGIEIAPNDQSPLAISLQGEMVVETKTCRLQSVKLQGPVSLSSIERTEGGIFQYTAGGALQLAIHSKYQSDPAE
jgi:hypothetical protein